MTTATLVLGSIICALVVINAILLMERRKPEANAEATSLLLTQMAVIGEKLAHIEPVVQATNAVQTDLRGLAERLSTVESNQGTANHGIASLATDSLTAIAELKTLTSGLNEAAGAMRTDLAHANSDLTELHTHVKDARDAERQTAEAVKRIETVFAGTQTKGLAGENVLEAVFSKLPAEWQLRDFILGGKCVEFALRLPNGLVLPIDSKWPATNLLEQFVATEDAQEQQTLKKQIEETVLHKAKELRKYLDPSVTASFGVAVVPDAAFDLCGGIQSEAIEFHVALISYSLFVPYLLLVFQTTLKAGHSLDLQKVDAYLRNASECITDLQHELDGRFSTAMTMISNSGNTLRALLGKLGGGLAGLQMTTSTSPALPDMSEQPAEEVVPF